MQARSGRAGPHLGPSAKVAYDVASKIGAGVESYGGVGPVSAFDPLRRQQHLVLAVVDLDLGSKWEFNAGVGFGLTPATDGLTFKMILGYRFDWGSGRQAR